MPAITKKKKQILDFIQAFQTEHGYYPTLEEIRQQFELNSLSTVHQHMSELEEMGMLERGFGKARDIKMSNKGSKVSTAEPYLVGSMVELPIAGLITAGLPIEAVEERTETLTVPRHMIDNKNAYVLKVKGDSMIESLIDDGDFVVIQKQDYASDGDIVVALLEDGSATLKEYHREKNYVRLQPRNTKYKAINVRNVVIQGRVLGIIRKY
ncbi:MAG: transcriptional repressor LexA [Candidatus Kerfeldbacteria bacterium]|nr:transcriptional repressor LexA [Candidatus Kerfeldbacteria bacterium]